MNGIINVYKEKGYTSFDVVAVMRGILKEKKIGHTGTLDPDAEGVLVLCAGNATKIAGSLTDGAKSYRAELLLGKTSDTQDISGTILEEMPVEKTEEEIIACIKSFIGEQYQIPPMYSAIKINGQKLCDLARKGREVDRTPRKITVSDIRILNIDLPVVTIEVDCSKGTYIRTICHDIGIKLGCGGLMQSLVRTKVGSFEVKDAVRIDEMRNMASKDDYSFVQPVDVYYGDMRKVLAEDRFDKALDNGNKIPYFSEDAGDGEIFRIYKANNKFIGLYKYNAKERELKPFKMFL